MKTWLGKIRALRTGKVLGITALAVIWSVLLLGVAVPSWRDVRRQQQEIDALSQELADLDRWTVAGLWLEPVVAARTPGVERAWNRAFPPVRDREQLFLQIAQVADRQGVADFQLQEIDASGSFDMGTWSSANAPPSDSPPPGDEAMLPDEGPLLTMTPYVVRASFVADYARTAAFLGGLEAIERTIDVRRLSIRPARSGVTVELELEVPVSDPIST